MERASVVECGRDSAALDTLPFVWTLRLARFSILLTGLFLQ
jgi:hypothetical protein